PPQHLELALLELPRGAVSWSTVRSHAGQQCHLVLQGPVRANYEDHTYRLEEGDSILWDATTPYRLENIGDNDVQILITMAPASLWKQGGEKSSNEIAEASAGEPPVNVASVEALASPLLTGGMQSTSLSLPTGSASPSSATSASIATATSGH